MHKTSTSLTNYCFLFCSLSLFRLLLDLAQRSSMEQFGLPKPQGVDTEGAKFTHLCSSSRNTEEMEALFVIIKNAIDNNLTLFIYIQGECVLFISFSLHVILTLIVLQVKPVLEKQLLPRSCVHMFDRAAKLRWVALPLR